MMKLFRLAIAVAAVALLSACTGIRYPITHRDVSETPVAEMYQHEHGYIKARRQAVLDYLRPNYPDAAAELEKTYAKSPPLGLAFSGGGLRSATFNLGVMQALESHNKLLAFDYLSTVSGGSYIGSWYVAHCLPNNQPDILDKRGVLACSADPKKLLLHPSSKDLGIWEGADPVMHLRGHASFFFDESGIGAVKILGWYLLLWTPNFLTDFVFHYKPLRGKWNWYHLFYKYQEAVETTYLTPPVGKDTILLKEINPPGSKAPYLVINATLATAAKKRPFEFTRDYVGGETVGFVPVDAFDKEVHNVKWENGRPVETEVFERPWKLWPKTPPFKLATAVTASGAALDSAGTPLRFIADPAIRFLNLNTRYETRNYSQNFSQWYWRWYDRLREMTYDRWFTSTRSNTLKISDGGHYDNLGVSALVRRRVKTIVAFDATADKEFKYKSLRQSQKAVRRETCGNATCLGLIWKLDSDPLRGFPPKSYITKGRISCDCEKPKQACDIDIYYCKLATLPDDPALPKYVRHFLNRSKSLGDAFPYTSTARQWYNWTEFEAYRQLGYHIGMKALQSAEAIAIEDAILKPKKE